MLLFADRLGWVELDEEAGSGSSKVLRLVGGVKYNQARSAVFQDGLSFLSVID